MANRANDAERGQRARALMMWMRHTRSRGRRRALETAVYAEYLDRAGNNGWAAWSLKEAGRVLGCSASEYQQAIHRLVKERAIERIGNSHRYRVLKPASPRREPPSPLSVTQWGLLHRLTQSWARGKISRVESARSLMMVVAKGSHTKRSAKGTAMIFKCTTRKQYRALAKYGRRLWHLAEHAIGRARRVWRAAITATPGARNSAALISWPEAVRAIRVAAATALRL